MTVLSRTPYPIEVLRLPWYKGFDRDERLITGQSYARLKRMFDLSLCLLGLPFFLLLLLLCALLIKLDSPDGPILVRQQRTGRGGRRFAMYKLRTMVANAEELKPELMHLNERQSPDFKITNDPRITRVGRLLRKTSLDELPQIFNVIKGEMSLVGPRPTSFDSSTYSLWQTARLDTTPGLTGLWQIVGRNDTEFDQRLRLDIAYNERQSLWLDLNILLRTVVAVVERRGAH